MPTSSLLLKTALLTVTALACARAWADLPNPRTLTYELHETPTEASSPIIYTYAVHLTAKEQSGSSISWGVDSMTIKQWNSSGQVIETWIDNAPVIQTSDSRWWVTHSDPANPQLSEFTDSPLIDGIAQSSATGGESKDYSLGGSDVPQNIYSPGLRAYLFLRRHGNPTPDVEVDDAPIGWHDQVEPT